MAQKPIEYSFNIQSGSQKKQKVILLAESLNLSKDAKIQKINNDSILIYDKIVFNNTVVYKASKTYNRVYREQSNGFITFQIILHKEGKRTIVSIRNFQHQPEMKFDNLNFGRITESKIAPKEITAMTNEEYSTEVWMLIKKTIDNYSNKIKDSYSGIVSVDNKESIKKNGKS